MSSNPWNDFQQDHAGEGLSHADMSEMYHADQDAGESSADQDAGGSSADQDAGESGAELKSTTDMNDTSGSGTDNDSGLIQAGEANTDENYELSSKKEEDVAKNEIDNENESSSKSSNQWNDFQHQHAGEGLSHTDMSEMYHADQDAGGSSADQDAGESGAELKSTTDMNDTSSSGTDNDSGLIQAGEANTDENYELSSKKEEDVAKNEIDNENESSSKSSNQWNDFQHQHAGEGLSHTDMSEMYQAEQKSGNFEHPTTPTSDTTEDAVDHNDDGTIPSNHTLHTATKTDSEATINPDNDTQPKNESANQNNNDLIEGNRWNDFQHKHKNEGKISSELSEMYRKENDTYSSVQETSESPKQNSQDGNLIKLDQLSENNGRRFSSISKQVENIREVNRKLQDQSQNENDQKTNNSNGQVQGELSSCSCQNQWNKFEHEHKNLRLNRQQMATLYHDQQQQEQPQTQPQTQQEQITNNHHVGSVHTASNEWNKFEHEHKNLELNRQQMTTLYHQQQEQQGRTLNNACENSTPSALNDRNKSEHEQSNLKLPSKQMGNSQNQQRPQMQKPKATIQWNLFQHLYRGKHLTKQEIANKYSQFKVNEETFYWRNEMQLVLTPDGKLKDPNSLVGHEAVKTGLFDEKNSLRRKGDVPYRVFHAKMIAMGINDQSIISSMYLNTTGSRALHTINLRKNTYRQHAAVGTKRRDPDHILELQVVASELYREHLDEENFHMLRCVLNSEDNIESRGVKFNRYIKAVANRGIARNDIKLENFTFKQEERQAQHATHLADLCHERGCGGAETVLRRLADKCNSLHAIHDQVMQLDQHITDYQEKYQRKCLLIESIHQYEDKYGSLNFHGSNFTEYRKKILDEAHRV